VVELGRGALWVALLGGLAAALAPTRSVTAAKRGRDRPEQESARRSRGPAVLAEGLLALAVVGALVATTVLAEALVTNDFSLAYVADVGRRGVAAPYRLAGLWGGMAGSLLWFASLSGAAGLVAATRLADRRSAGQVASVTGALVATLAGLVLMLADPFVALAVPSVDGAGLTPILEHPAMLYHPPLLYLGLATLVGPFALTVAALANGGLDGAWLATVRRWSLLPWALLALGMVAGSHWAYVELGWGGYWAWDPVENTALLPWLALTLLVHAARGLRLDAAADGEPRPDRWALSPIAVAGLACLPFLLALVGILLTRSGATSSVHAFAEDRAIGRALGGVVVLAAVAVAALVWRARWLGRGAPEPAPAPQPHGRHRRPSVTVAGLLTAHIAVVGSALAVVLAGTLWPLAAQLRGGAGIAVEGLYFARFTAPLAGAALALMCLVPVARSLVGARSMDGARSSGPATRTVVLAALAGAFAGWALVAYAGPRVDIGVGVLAAVAGACVSASVADVIAAGRGWSAEVCGGGPAGRGRRSVAGAVVHAAFGLLVIGIAGTATGGSETVPVSPGDSVTVFGGEVVYAGVAVVDGPVPEARAVVAEVTVDGRGRRPELVAYPDRGLVLAETSLVSTPWRDVQVALRDARDDGSALLEIGVHPLQVLVWWGGLGLAAGGALAAVEASRRHIGG
jgi:cytochrome c-type biogenesis protein CcmF